jgi:hypothetical protein
VSGSGGSSWGASIGIHETRQAAAKQVNTVSTADGLRSAGRGQCCGRIRNQPRRRLPGRPHRVNRVGSAMSATCPLYLQLSAIPCDRSLKRRAETIPLATLYRLADLECSCAFRAATTLVSAGHPNSCLSVGVINF